MSIVLPSPFQNPRRTLKSIKSLLIDPLLRFISFLLPPMSTENQPNSNQEEDRRPWEPPFDPSKPSIPISYPITDLQTLESRSYFDSFHFPFNRSSVPLPSDAVEPPSRPRLLVCHDMMGGYRDDVWVQGGTNPDAYAIWHWHLIDVFVYFSHYLVTLPPPGWVNAAHTHGVKVLGTFITEWDEGKVACETLLSTKDSARMYAERLAELAFALGFDGWLINVEVKLGIQLIGNLKEFVHHLSQTMHSSVPGSLVIWYDAVTIDGKLNWQDQLNDRNKPFFDLCDGIFVNYTWKENYPKVSAAVAGERKFDVYMGIDVFGRNTFGGGQWNTDAALHLLKEDDVSAAIFAPGWVYETKQGADFQSSQTRWWGLVEQSWGILQSYPKLLPFYSNFDQGHGYHLSVEGLKVADDPWCNISCQGFQPVLDYSTDSIRTGMEIFINFKDTPYSGGGSITVKGSLRHDASFSTRLFNGRLPLENTPVHILYSVKADGDSVLGLCLELLTETADKTHALIANDAQLLSFGKELENKYNTIIQAEKSKAEVLADKSWVLYKASFQLNDHTLTGISIICILKRTNGITRPAVVKSTTFEQPKVTDEYSPYCASLGHICIRTSEQDMKFPPANAWFTEGQHILWAQGSHGTKSVSLKLVWQLKAEYTIAFVKYNIYVEKQIVAPDTEDIISRSYLGVARVEALYVSDLDVPNEVTALKFIIQVCGPDGSCQELEKSPTFILTL
ncbi:cytosolic endo-beta-N-acetylglucosaminidase 1 [Typha angustifolia]|uniref:cytosolic endo-beta-N-acetylglucosaminidase 1 n=1 Tax=Typha angustifolia TaxID=59011 RepID=UPI003C2B6A44